MIRALLLVALAGCATTHHAEQQVKAAASSESKLSGTEQVQQTTQSGPETITTTVEEWAQEIGPGSGENAPASDRPAASTEEAAGSPRPSHPAPILLKRTVTVDQRGPASTQTTVNAQATTETHAAEKVDAKAKADSSFKPGGILGSLLGLWPLLLAGGVAALAYWRKDLLFGMIKKFLP